MGKKKERKWNRVNYFARKKSTRRQVGHPVLVYSTSGRDRKFLTFTHKPEDGKEGNYEKLKHNISPKDSRDCYVKKTFNVSKYDSLRKPDEKYRIHPEDKETIKKYKK